MLARSQERGGSAQVNKTKNKREITKTEYLEIHSITRTYYEQLFSLKMEKI